ncbi:M50 family metallopeptidase [Nocardioides sambongensis]|uniref:M50 family metallopeptidase n=1 Tax=Nocardioides sambongensis TaxID=2589074 RepID=UPI001128B85E|nr:M50 family metallopeptidase [Nocardioides sambongensis]
MGTVLERIAGDLTAVQPEPSPRTLLLTMLLGAFLVVWGPAWRRTRHVVTIAHEGGHAVVAMLCGRRLQGIRLHSDTSGLTVSRGRPTGPGMVATAFAGYPAPAVVGLIAALLVADGRAFAALWATVLLLALMLVAIRNLYGLLVILVAGGATIAVSWWAAPEAKVAVSYVVTWVLLLGAPRAVLELAAERRRTRSGRSDADQLARLTPIPAGLWVALFLVATGAAAVVSAGALSANARL